MCDLVCDLFFYVICMFYYKVMDFLLTNTYHKKILEFLKNSLKNDVSMHVKLCACRFLLHSNLAGQSNSYPSELNHTHTHSKAKREYI